MVANKVYDGNTAATMTSRSLAGVVGSDAVSLVGDTATFASKNAGTQAVTLAGATLAGAAAGNYVLDTVATTTATIAPKALTGGAITLPVTNVASAGVLLVAISPNAGGIVDGQSVAQLFNGASFSLSVGGRTYRVRAQATVVFGVVGLAIKMTAELKSILAANTTATNLGKAPTVALNVTATSNDGNYTLAAAATTRLYNSAK